MSARVYLALARAGVRSRMAYRVSFLTRLVALTLTDLVPLLLLGTVLTRFPSIAGWRFGEIALLYGLIQAASALSRTLGWPLDHFDELVASGDLDATLTRPVVPLLAVIAARIDATQVGRALLGLGVLAVAFRLAGVAPTASHVALAGAAVAGGALILFSLTLLVAALSFWQTRTGKLQDIVQGATRGFAELPLGIYPGPVRAILTWVLPLALATYYPAVRLLGRPAVLGPAWLSHAALPAGALMLALALSVWRAGLARYQSTGS